MSTDFTANLLHWYSQNRRDLPWRKTKDPYVIWLSEIILQQTRVSQGLPYFERFLKHFPTVDDFASASEDDILKLWQGLGYYSRGRNMLKAAKTVMEEFDGKFPNSYKSLLQLPGVGPYTAAAIGSFAFDLPHPVLDGNVQRVIARYFGITEPVNEKSGEKKVIEGLHQLFEPSKAADFNQAIMEFGALHCTPKAPACDSCPVAASCAAFEKKQQSKLPVKVKKTKVRERFLNYLIPVSPSGQTVIKKRTAKGIWHNLHDFPLIETKSDATNEMIRNGISELFRSIGSTDYDPDQLSEWNTTHLLSHQKLRIKFVVIELEKDFSIENQNFISTHISQILSNFAVPIIIEKFVRDAGWA